MTREMLITDSTMRTARVEDGHLKLTLPNGEVVDFGVVVGETVTDAGIAAQIANPASQTATQLSATIAAQTERSTAQLDIDADVARVAAKFAPRGAGISLRRVGTTYSLRRAIGGGRYWRCDLPLISSAPGGFALHQIRDQMVELAAESVVFGDGSVASSGTWVTTTQAAAYGGQYTQASAAGAYKEHATPAGTTVVGMRTCDLSNAGLAVVTIDGDKTAATLLPTAQELVDMGLYPNTILVANGGTLEPTDRVYEGRQSNATVWDKVALFASDLTPGVHQVRVAVTGYFHTGDYPGLTGSTSSGARVYITGFVHGDDTMREGDAGVSLLPVANLMDTGSAWEYATNLKPEGAASSQFVGNIHGYEIEDSLAFFIDGAPVTPADATSTPADREAKIVRTSHLRHPETGSAVIADVVTTYTMDRRGLLVEAATSWRVNASVIAAYVMMPLNGATKVTGVPFTHGSLSGWAGGPIDLTALPDGYYGQSESSCAWVWDGTARGVYGAAIWVPDALRYTRGYATQEFLPNIQARPSSGPMTKVYIPRAYTTAPENVTPETVWEQAARYAVAYLPEGAHNSLSAF
ncbi:hypothetical protein [Microbacterium esteraromaticum]|uniref:hypothetical protein n=1 Tax=Microbacterium esteraromaticum TaxID=57043 RepID=UPI0019D37611|nr:hypothetical protein [Microbacterium esteraromaticum]MBN7792436.1 hypothetical protein [Microbacterium esteraromaticum]